MNPHNSRAALKLLKVVKAPIKFILYLITGAGSPTIKVRTPTGVLSVTLRNHESARTFFSIFLREDYPLSSDSSCGVLDVGSNIGLSALYFLSRNTGNRVFCVEPDPVNIDFLEKNLEQFASRSFVLKVACTDEEARQVTFYLSQDGKYSSLLPNENRHEKLITVPARPLESIVMEAINFLQVPTFSMKIDVEGMEQRILYSLSADTLAKVNTIFVEGLGIGEKLPGLWEISIRSGYVEVIKNRGRDVAIAQY